jgi:hypothetical protein
VTDVIECGLFWCNIHDKAHADTLQTIQQIMNGPVDAASKQREASDSLYYRSKYALKSLNPNGIQVDTLCVTKYTDPTTNETQLYRANIINVKRDQETCRVIFVDFGNVEKKRYAELFEMTTELKQYPFQAFKCKLANIKICPFKNPNGK